MKKKIHFDGRTYEAKHDHARLTRQLERVKKVMLDGRWRTLLEIAARTGDSMDSSIGARVRDLRKVKFGSFVVRKRRCGDPSRGKHEYRLMLDPQGQPLRRTDPKEAIRLSKEDCRDALDVLMKFKPRPPELDRLVAYLEGRVGPRVVQAKPPKARPRITLPFKRKLGNQR